MSRLNAAMPLEFVIYTAEHSALGKKAVMND